MNKLDISFILPIYNVEKYLHRCINSILAQKLDNIEIILVDDESPDNCPKICDEYAKQYHFIKVIHKKNQGLGMARNSGLEVATGRYVYFVDSDDYLKDNSIKKLLSYSDENNLDVCYGGIIEIDSEGNERKCSSEYFGKQFYNEELMSIVLKNMLGTKPSEKIDCIQRMSVWQGLYKKSIIDDNNIKFVSEREYISEDIPFQIDYFKTAKSFGCIDEYCYYHITDNVTSLTHKYNPRRFELSTTLINLLTEKLQDLDESYVERAQRTYFGNIRVCLKQIVANLRKKNALIEINKIATCETFKSIVKKYPLKYNPISQRIVMTTLKIRLNRLTYFIVKKHLGKEG